MTSQRLASQPNRTSRLGFKHCPRPVSARSWTRAAASVAWAAAYAFFAAVCLDPPLAADVLAGDPASIEVKPAAPPQARPSSLESGWVNPPRSSRVRAYWWWLKQNSAFLGPRYHSSADRTLSRAGRGRHAQGGRARCHIEARTDRPAPPPRALWLPVRDLSNNNRCSRSSARGLSHPRRTTHCCRRLRAHPQEEPRRRPATWRGP